MEHTEEDEGNRPGWIIDAHTHILPPRLALKIRSFFTSQIRQATNAVPTTTSTSSASAAPSCCGGGNTSGTFSDKLDWTAEDFTQHGSFELAYHPHDPIELTKQLQATAIDTIWVLPYAHKADVSKGLNTAILDVCSSLEDNTTGKGLTRAIVAFTVHPDDGPKGVEEASLQALTQGNAKVAKLHCSVGRYSVLDENLEPFWKLANKVHFPVVVHFGSSESGNTASQELLDIEELLKKYSEVRLIIAHSGHPAVVRGMKLAMQHEHVYLDTTPVVTVVPNYPPRSHPLHADLIDLAKRGKILFGSDMPNVAVSLPDQIQAVFDTFAEVGWTRPSQDKWWTQRKEAQRAGKAVEQVLFGAAQRLVEQVDVTPAKYQQTQALTSSNSKM